jgi:DNA polymerase-3 subunit delta
VADLLQEIARGKIAPVYFLVGERYPRDQVLQALREAVLAGDDSDFNFESLDAQECDAAQILSAARTIPMLGGQRLVVVREAHRLAAGELARLLPYVKDPSPSTCLVLLGDKADTRLKFFVQLKKSGVLQKFEPLKERQAPGWLSAEARRRRVKLAPGAAERIAEAVGTDMGRLASALEQLSLYVGPGRQVTAEAAEELLAETRERSIFELTNAVGRGQRRQALRVLQRMLDSREPGVRMVAMLARHLRQLWIVKELSGEGADRRTIASQAGLHPYFVKDMARQAGRIRVGTLRRMHRALFEADRALKSSKLPDGVILQRLVMELCPAE